MSDMRQEETKDISLEKKPKSSNDKKNVKLKNFTNKNSIFFINSDEQDDLDEENMCLFKNCKLKR